MKVLKFGAVWCPGCFIMKPLWEEIEKEDSGLQTEYFDADTNTDLMKKYGISDLPCFIFLNKEGVEIDRLVGEVDKEKIMDLVNKYKNS